MPNVSFFPIRDDALLSWSANFIQILTLAPTSYGLTALQCTSYQTLHDNYATALAACEPSIRTRQAVADKNDAKTNLKNSARLLANIIYGQATVTDGQKLALGLTVRSMPAPIPAPSDPPAVKILSTSGRTVRITLSALDSERRAKPAGVHGAAVFSYVGATPPDSTDDWKFEGNTNQKTLDLNFPESVASGATVWITAFWFNPRSLSGPAATPISCNLPGGAAPPLSEAA